MASLYAQLESLTTTVAQLRRDAPGRAAKEYAAQLEQVIKEEEEEEEEGGELDRENVEVPEGQVSKEYGKESDAMDVDANKGATLQRKGERTQTRRHRKGPDPAWDLQITLGSDEMTERWRSGDTAVVYENALRTLQRLQGEGDTGTEGSPEGNALATTVGKAERAGRAAEVVENM